MLWFQQANDPIVCRQGVLISLPWTDLSTLVGLLVFDVHVAVVLAPGALCMLGKHSTTVPHLSACANPMCVTEWPVWQLRHYWPVL